MKKSKSKFSSNNSSVLKKDPKQTALSEFSGLKSGNKSKTKISYSKQESSDIQFSMTDHPPLNYPQTSVNSNSTAITTRNDNTNCAGEKATRIRVIARFRPLNMVEQEFTNKNAGQLCVKFIDQKTCEISTSLIMKTDFTLDSIFDTNTTQERFYKEIISETITDTINGYNGTVFTYGQSGSGKTFTMFGADIGNSETRGIIPRAVEQIFDYIENETSNSMYEIKFSILEIYKENLYDLLNPAVKYTDLKIKEDPKKGIYVQNLTIISVEDREEIYALLEQAEENRTVAETRLNKQSSRSHIVFMLYIKQKLPDDTEKLGTLNLVDLAGSEKVSKTGAIGETLEEAKKINSSLSALGNVISSLTSNNSEYIPYRDSKLTRLLQDSLGGNFKTTLIVTCSPHSYNAEETLSTLNFAKRAKKVKNKVKLNIKRSAEELERIVAQLLEKIRIMNEERLNSRTGSLVRFDENMTWSPNEGEAFKKKIEEYESIIKVKDEEITRLKDDIEGLTSEKEDLEKKVITLQKAIDLEKTIENIEKSIRNNLKDIESVYSNYKFQIENLYYDENLSLKDRLNTKEDTILADLNNVLKNDFKIDFTTKVTNMNINMLSLLENLKSSEEDQYLLKSYETTYKNCKIFMNDLIQEFVKKSDIFLRNEINSKEFNEKITVDRKQYIELKNSFIQISGLSMFYEKLLFDLLGKFSIDLKNYQISQKFTSDNTERICNLYKNFHDYLEILEEVKRMKYNLNAQCVTMDINTIGTKEINKPEITYRNKFLKNISRRNVQKINPFSLLIKNIIENGFNEERAKTQTDQTPRFQEDKMTLEKKMSSNKNEEPQSSERCPTQLSASKQNNEMLSTVLSTEKNQIDKAEPSASKKNKKLAFFDKLTKGKKINIDLEENNESKQPKSPNGERKFEEPKTAKNMTNFINGFSFVNKEAFNSSFTNKNEEMIELKLLRKEKQLNNQTILNLTRELTEVQAKTMNFERIVIEYQESLKNTYIKEQESLKLLYKIIKEFFTEEINYSKNVINELSDLFDDIVLNEKTFKKNLKDKILTNMYVEKKNNLIKREREGPNSTITDFFIKESGSATKKLDYLYIDFQKENKMSFVFGSGLNKNIPSKSPLVKNFNKSLFGDIGAEVHSPSD